MHAGRGGSKTQTVSLNGMNYSLILLLFIIGSQAGVSKLTEAKNLVDDLKRKANEQSVLLADKQQEADAALKEITVAMQVIHCDPIIIMLLIIS